MKLVGQYIVCDHGRDLLGVLYTITNELGCVRVAGAWEWRARGGACGGTALNKMAEARAPIFEFQFRILE